MKRYNIILLADAVGEKVLMCRRMKPPYQGLMNLVGGKAEEGEDGLHAAYRELREETGVTAADTTLRLMVTFSYPTGGAGLPPYELQAYVGRLRRDTKVCGSENPLCWTPLTEEFFDLERYAGEGSIGHAVEIVRRYRPEMLEASEVVLKLVPLMQEHLPILAYYQGAAVEALQPMLAASREKQLEGRYYEQFAICIDGCVVGVASLYAHEDDTVSDGIEIFPPFRRCGFAAQALALLAKKARELGYCYMSAQVRTDNTASIALHKRAGFAATATHVNRRGNEVYRMVRTLGIRHEMSLRPKPFAKIANGEKTYELRLNDEKRRQIRVGDEILFTCTEDERSVLTRVTGLHPFADFGALYATLPLTKCGYTPENVLHADPKDMEAYYPPEKQARYGVLAIELERVRYPLEALNDAYAVRLLTADDVPEMLRLAQGNPLYYEYMRITPTTENLNETLTALPPRRTMADKHFFGWFDSGRLVAMMDLIARHPADGKAFIGWFMVDEGQQGRGLGRRLVAQTMQMLNASGVKEVRLGRVEGNPQSERFWRACGFAENGLGYDAEEYHVVIMAKTMNE